MDPPQVSEYCGYAVPRVKLSAKAKEVLARCVTELEREDTRLDGQDLVRLNSIASRRNSVEVSGGNITLRLR